MFHLWFSSLYPGFSFYLPLHVLLFGSMSSSMYIYIYVCVCVCHCMSMWFINTCFFGTSAILSHCNREWIKIIFIQKEHKPFKGLIQKLYIIMNSITYQVTIPDFMDKPSRLHIWSTRRIDFYTGSPDSSNIFSACHSPALLQSTEGRCVTDIIHLKSTLRSIKKTCERMDVWHQKSRKTLGKESWFQDYSHIKIASNIDNAMTLTITSNIDNKYYYSQCGLAITWAINKK